MAETGRQAGFSRLDRLRHGRHVDRCQPFRRRTRTHLRDRSGGRAGACADDADPHGGSGRRIDPAFRRGEIPGRPGLLRRQSGADLLPPRRPAIADRRQCHGRQAHPGILSENFRTTPRPTTRCGSGSTGIQRASRTGRWRAIGRGRRRRISSGSRSRTWPTRSRKSPSNAATT